MATTLNIGSRAQVMHGSAKKTSGGLLKKDLAYNKSGSIVSKKKSLLAKKSESGLLKLWRKAIKDVSASKQYEEKFVVAKRGSVFHKKVFSKYEELVRSKYAKTHTVTKKKVSGVTKLVLVKKTT
jgi:hypothetical protein